MTTTACPHADIRPPRILPNGSAELGGYTCWKCGKAWTTEADYRTEMGSAPGRVVRETTALVVPDGKRIRSLGTGGDYISRAEAIYYSEKVDRAWRHEMDQTRIQGIAVLTENLNTLQSALDTLETEFNRFAQFATLALEARSPRGRLRRFWAWLRRRPNPYLIDEVTVEVISPKLTVERGGAP